MEDHGDSRPELAYWILPEYHGEGYGREAVTLAVDIVFQGTITPLWRPGRFPTMSPRVGY